MFSFSFIQLRKRRRVCKKKKKRKWNMDESKCWGESMLNSKWSLLVWKTVYKVKQNHSKENRDNPAWNSIVKTNLNQSND